MHFENVLSWVVRIRPTFDVFLLLFCFDALLFYTCAAAAMCFSFPIKFTKHFYSPLNNQIKSVNFVNKIFCLINIIVSLLLSEVNAVEVTVLLCWTRFSFFERATVLAAYHY